MSQERLKEVTRPRAAPRQAEGEAEKVRVMYGVHSLEASVAGRTVASVREALAQPLNISPRAVALVDGREVEETHVLSPGELLEFVRYAGEKGAASLDAERERGHHRQRHRSLRPGGRWRRSQEDPPDGRKSQKQIGPLAP